MTTNYARSPQALSAQVDDDIVALQAERGFAFGMEGVTAAVWQRLETPASLDQLVAGLLEEYEVDAAQCRSEVTELLAQLVDEGLVVEEQA